MKISCAYFSHPGKVRAVNQDGIFLNGEIVKEGDFKTPVVTSFELPDGSGLFVVVDGAGGHSVGEAACGAILTEMKSSVEHFGQLHSVGAHNLTNELIRIQGVMSSMANLDSSLYGMAATLAGIYFMCGRTGEDPPCGMGIAFARGFLSRRTALVFNCGDCRAYRMSGGVLSRLTHDHSYIQQLCDEEKITEDEMRTHPRKNVVTAALKAGKISVKLNCSRCEMEPPERFLICCDGVWEALPHGKIEKCLTEPSLRNAANQLCDEILKTGCEDNVSFILLEISA
jgi:serine/threonine protein phosphatase PrpC